MVERFLKWFVRTQTKAIEISPCGRNDTKAVLRISYFHFPLPNWVRVLPIRPGVLQISKLEYKTCKWGHQTSNVPYKTFKRAYKTCDVPYQTRKREYKTCKVPYKTLKREYKTSNVSYQTLKREYKTCKRQCFRTVSSSLM